jgi:hypothetical protein
MGIDVDGSTLQTYGKKWVVEIYLHCNNKLVVFIILSHGALPILQP